LFTRVKTTLGIFFHHSPTGSARAGSALMYGSLKDWRNQSWCSSLLLHSITSLMLARHPIRHCRSG